MEKKSAHFSTKWKMTALAGALLSLTITLIGAVFGALSFRKELAYREDLALGDNSPVSYCVSEPSSEQIDQIAAIDSVASVTPVYVIERDVDFAKSKVLFYGIDHLQNNSIKGTFFDSLLEGDGTLGEDDIYVDKTIKDSYGLSVGTTASVSFGTVAKTFTVKGILTPVMDVLGLTTYSDPHQGIILFRYTSTIESGFTTKPHIAYAPITKKENVNSGALETYLSTYKPLGKVDTYEVYRANYVKLHSQGTYSDAEWEKMIQDAYKQYYDDAVTRLSTGYQTKASLFRDLYSDSTIKALEEASKQENMISQIVAAFAFLPLVIASILTASEEQEIIKEGQPVKGIKESRNLSVHLPVVGMTLITFLAFFISNILVKGGFAGISLDFAFLRTGIIGITISLIFGLCYFLIYPTLPRKQPSKEMARR
jgi:hypothetical protein